MLDTLKHENVLINPIGLAVEWFIYRERRIRERERERELDRERERGKLTRCSSLYLSLFLSMSSILSFKVVRQRERERRES